MDCLRRRVLWRRLWTKVQSWSLRESRSLRQLDRQDPEEADINREPQIVHFFIVASIIRILFALPYFVAAEAVCIFVVIKLAPLPVDTCVRLV